MDRKILAVGMIGLSLSLLVACGDKTNTQEPQQESDQSVIQQSDQQPMEVKQEAPANQDGASPEATTLGIVGAVDGSGETEESVPVDGIGEVETVGEVGTDELFTEVEETVYAISTVNIRASWSVDSDKLGSLSSGDSLTRIGIGIAGTEAEIWSKVVLSDGSIAYVGSSYLSTTKPVQQQTQTQTQPQEKQQTLSSSGGKGLTLAEFGFTPEKAAEWDEKAKQKDWSQYEPVDAGELTGEKIVEGWKNIQ